MELLDCLKTIVDPRRPQGRLYPLAPLLFISVLAVLAGADSYRKIARFIDAHRLRLNAWLGLKWKRAPAHTAIRYAFVNLSPEAVEAAFRAHSAALAAQCEHPEDCIAVDGKALKGSFDAMLDKHAAQVLSAFTHAKQLILGHIPMSEKSNEIPAAQQLIAELGLKGRVFTLDAEHCQKNLRGGPSHGQPSHRSSQRQPAEVVEANEGTCP
jgi:DDE_Tnp_1-associated